MPVINDATFRAPANLDLSIWRYLDWSKFLHMLHTGTLWFARADFLGDPFEGVPNKSAAERVLLEYQQRYGVEEAAFHKAAWDDFVSKGRKRIFINCWYTSEYESAGMWNGYTPAGGLAIKSSYGRLCNSLQTSEDVLIGEVQYKDANESGIDEHNPLSWFAFKRPAFEYEHELRAVVRVREENEELLPVGIAIPVSLADLITEVRLPPRCQRWQVDVVEGLIATYGLSTSVKRSSLDDAPGL